MQQVQTDVYIILNIIHLKHFPKDKKLKEQQIENEDKIQQYNSGESI